ncbi:NAD(P)-binding protein [Mycena venus]|uniref:NAD(P)-binding protein n=1 Tax=Mycena venus TaxID=2733690 RepID=A0A8H6X2L0_9AGAR|nr:NAD(P)-binding protein [Mycena venus]
MAPRVWFITGASSGFGFLMAKTALANGEKVVATLRKPEVISAFAAQYTKDQLIVLKLDVTKPEDITAGFAAAKEAFGRIDILFNNAGVSLRSTSGGAVNVTKAAIPFLRDVNKPSGGILINMSSMLGIDAAPGAGFYAATKFALEAVTDSVARELDPAWNIRVMIFCPGYFKTNIHIVNAEIEPVHSAYAGNEKLGSIQTRAVFAGLVRGDSPLFQDPTKLINKVWDIVNLENPPYRVAFGEDAKALFQAKLTSLKKDLEASEEWSKDLTY